MSMARSPTASKEFVQPIAFVIAQWPLVRRVVQDESLLPMRSVMPARSSFANAADQAGVQPRRQERR
jgi:hypothetical protein